MPVTPEDMMMKRRYTIEASIDTLARFTAVCKQYKSEVFVQRLSCNSSEEYYYVVLIATTKVHQALKGHRFTNSYPMAA